ncbi:hypothetical protein SporoP32a_11735 [Sporosarcina ureae]|nr:hypothetical protein SporoP32a_11735 [Sporosarcina ureae]
MRFLGFVIILLILSIPFEMLLNKLFSVEKKKISETPGKRIDRWGRGIILVVSLGSLPFVVVAEPVIIKWVCIFYCVVQYGFQSILEWKYLKGTNQHIVTFAYLLVGVILFYNAEYLFRLLR